MYVLAENKLVISRRILRGYEEAANILIKVFFLTILLSSNTHTTVPSVSELLTVALIAINLIVIEESSPNRCHITEELTCSF